MQKTAHITSATTVLVSGAVLLVLAGASFVLSTFHLGALGVLVALGIAAVKATIVVSVFMELAKEQVSVRLAALAAALMLLLLVSLMTADVVTREAPPAGAELPLGVQRSAHAGWEKY